MLGGAQLQGASFYDAQLQGAFLVAAQLQGASLDGAQLQGALLAGAQLQGASLDGAQLQGASLNSAQLQGASLDGAQLQGASLNGAQLQSALLRYVFIWRAEASKIQARGAYAEDIVSAAKYRLLDCEMKDPCDWSVQTYTALRQDVEQAVPAGQRRDEALGRISRLDPEKTGKESYEVWANLERSRPTPSNYTKYIVSFLRIMGCDARGVSYVVQGLSMHIYDHFGDDLLRAGELAAAFLDEANCPVARGMPEPLKRNLRRIRDSVQPEFVKPHARAKR